MNAEIKSASSAWGRQCVGGGDACTLRPAPRCSAADREGGAATGTGEGGSVRMKGKEGAECYPNVYVDNG